MEQYFFGILYYSPVTEFCVINDLKDITPHYPSS